MNVVSLARELISINTVNPPGQESACAEYLGTILEEGGFRIGLHDLAEGRASLIARIEGSGDRPPLCFTGHMDTVPLGGAEWKRDPLVGELDGDKLYGRGSSDMKGGLAAMVVAALGMAELKDRKAGMTLVITASEENACRGALHLAGLDGVLGSAGAMVVGEPTSNYPLVGHKGALWIEVNTRGVAAHSSMPSEGVNAIHKAAQAVTKLKDFRFDVSPHPVLGAPTLSVSTISGGTSINSVPDRAVIGVDIRTIPGQDNRVVFEQMESLLGDEAKLDCLVDVEGIWTDPEHDWIRQVFEILERYLPQRPVARGAAYFTDASFLKPAYADPPTVILGPGEPAMAHKTDEFCYVSKMEDAVEAYSEIARRWCGV